MLPVVGIDSVLENARLSDFAIGRFQCRCHRFNFNPLKKVQRNFTRSKWVLVVTKLFNTAVNDLDAVKSAGPNVYYKALIPGYILPIPPTI